MAWFSKTGVLFRTFSGPLAVAGTAAVIGVYFYPHTLGLQYYQRHIAHYKDSAMSPIDSQTQQLIEKVFLHELSIFLLL